MILIAVSRGLLDVQIAGMEPPVYEIATTAIWTILKGRHGVS